MSQDFKLRYEQLRAGDPTKTENAADATSETSFYEMPSHSRNLCLSWPDGRRMFLNYAYLLAGELAEGGEVGIITLHFSTLTMTLKGYALSSLFAAILNQMAHQIAISDHRYFNSKTIETLVVEATVSKNISY